MLPLPPHSSTRIPSLSGSTPSASKTSGNMSFSVRPSTSTAQRARNSSARPLSNSDKRAEHLGLRERLGLEERRPARRRVPDERELLEPVDAEEDRRVRRVEDLVPRLGERPQEAVEAPLDVRAEIELRLLDQQHELAQVARRAASPCRRRARARRPPRPSDGRPSAAGTAPPPRRRRARLRARRASASGGSPAGRAPGGAPARLRLSVSGGRASRKIVPFATSASRRIRPPAPSGATSSMVGGGAAASSSVQIAVRTVDLPLEASPTSAHTEPGVSSSSRAAR